MERVHGVVRYAHCSIMDPPHAVWMRPIGGASSCQKASNSGQMALNSISFASPHPPGAGTESSDGTRRRAIWCCALPPRSRPMVRARGGTNEQSQERHTVGSSFGTGRHVRPTRRRVTRRNTSTSRRRSRAPCSCSACRAALWVERCSVHSLASTMGEKVEQTDKARETEGPKR